MVFVVSVPFIYFKFFGEYPKSGFYCNDESISYPYKPSTVPLWALIFGILFPIFVLILVEELVLPLLAYPISNVKELYPVYLPAENCLKKYWMIV